MPGALFDADGGRLSPTELARGPWAADALHGGPVAALVARAVEACETPVPMRVVRLTLELLRAVPVAPLTVAARVVRNGKRVQLVEASISAGDTEVARGSAQRIRTAAVAVPDQAPSPATPTDPQAAPVRAFAPGGPVQGPAFHTAAVEMRLIRGRFDAPGPTAAWLRLLCPVVAGEEPSALQRAVALADFGNGLSSVVPFETHSFVNPDLTVALVRLPLGEWVGLDAVTRLSPDGIGMAESLLFDPFGPVGRAMQTLYLDAR